MRKFWIIIPVVIVAAGFSFAQEKHRPNPSPENSEKSDFTVEVVGDSIVPMYRFEEVVVYGRKQPAPGMIYQLDEEEMKSRGGDTVADLLKLDAGLVITSGMKAETQTSIRGFDPRDVLVLVDGRPINPGYYGKADLSMIPRDNIAKIKVVKGPASVAYGANAMGGVVNIVTKNGFGAPRTFVDTEFGVHGFRRLSLNHSRRWGKWNAWISGYEHHAKGTPLSGDFQPTALEDGGLRENSAYHKWGVSAKLGVEPSAKSDLALSVAYHWADKECPWTVYPWGDSRYMHFTDWERYGANLSGSWILSPRMELKSTVFVDAYHDRLKNYRNAEMNENELDFDSRLENWTVGGSSEIRWQTGPHRVHTGFHLRRDLMNKKPDTDELWYSHHHLTATFFAEDKLALWRGSTVTLGASASIFQNEEGDGVNHFSPMAALNQSIVSFLDARASWANAMRFPVMHQLYSESSGNAGLKPEEADKFEAGLEARASFWGCQATAEVAFFANDLKNLIYRDSRTARYRNIETARLQGWETRLTLTRNRGSVEFNYGFIDRARATAEMMEEVPRQQWGVAVTVPTPWNGRIRYSIRHVGDRTTEYVSRMLEPYKLHQLTVTQEVTRGVTFKLNAMNLTDENYQEEYGFPAMGRRITGGFSWTL